MKMINFGWLVTHCLRINFLVVMMMCLSESSSLNVGNTAYEYVDDLTFGVDPGTRKAWFVVVSKNATEIAYNNLQHMPDIFAGDFQSTSYSKFLSHSNWVTMTIISEDCVTITVHQNGSIITVSSEQDYEKSRPSTLRQLNSNGYVLRYYRGNETTVWCELADDTLGSTYRHSPGRLLARASRWEGCYDYGENPRFVDIGIVVERSFYQTHGSDTSKVMKAVESILANSNLVYFYTFNIFIRVRQVLLANSVEPENNVIDIVLNQGVESCTYNPRSLILEMSYWVKSLPVDVVTSLLPTTDRNNSDLVNMAHWHYLTACTRDGLVGTSVLGTVCDHDLGDPPAWGNVNGALNIAVTSFNIRIPTWITFAHEIGHSFNASHSFEDGEGTTGGIMDYGDGTLNGIYQFNEKYRYQEFCSYFRKMRGGLCEKSDSINYFPEMETQMCSEDVTFCASGFGKCVNSTCEIGEPYLVISTNGTDKFYVYDEAPWGQYTYRNLTEVLQGSLRLPDPVSGCEQPLQNYSDQFAIVQSGSCLVEEIVTIAQAAGASAVIIIKPEDDSEFEYSVGNTGFVADVPVVGISFAAGTEILNTLSTSIFLNATLGTVVVLESIVPSVDPTTTATSSPTSSPTSAPIVSSPAESKENKDVVWSIVLVLFMYLCTFKFPI